MSSESESDDDYYGPALPPGFKPGGASTTADSNKPQSSANSTSTRESQIGPALPPELRARLEANAVDDPTKSVQEGSSLSESERVPNADYADSESDDDDVIGPLPPDHPKALQRSSGPAKVSEKQKPKREEWMLVPPKNKIIPGLGLAPRKFLTRTPQDSRKSDSEDEDEALEREADAAIARKMIDEYDQKMDDIKKDFEAKKRRGESLLELHRKDMKKKKDEKSDDKKDRKPFDRDTDLQISGLSSGDKQKYIEKSKELNTKFSRGSRKYL